MSSKKSSLMFGTVVTACFAISPYATFATDADIDISTLKKGVGLPEKNRPSAGERWEKEMADKNSKEELKAEEAKNDRIAKIGESIKGTGIKQEPTPETKSTKPKAKAAQRPKMETAKPTPPKASASAKKPANNPPLTIKEQAALNKQARDNKKKKVYGDIERKYPY